MQEAGACGSPLRLRTAVDPTLVAAVPRLLSSTAIAAAARSSSSLRGGPLAHDPSEWPARAQYDEAARSRAQLAAADYVKGVPVANFKAAWDAMDAESEVAGTYQLAGTGGVAAAVEAMIASLGMYVAESTDVVAPNARSHLLMLSGELCGGHRALARIQFGADPSGAVRTRVTTRADDADVSQVVQDVIASED